MYDTIPLIVVRPMVMDELICADIRNIRLMVLLFHLCWQKVLLLKSIKSKQ